MMLKNKVAVIYGAGGDIGGGVASAFAREGAKVFLTGHKLAPVEAVARDIVAAGGPSRRRKSMLSTSRLSTSIYSP